MGVIQNNNKRSDRSHRFLLVAVLCLVVFCVSAHVVDTLRNVGGTVKKETKPVVVKDSAAGRSGQTGQSRQVRNRPAAKSKVYLLHSDLLRKDAEHPEAQIVIGNVRFRHDSIYMYCDSACYYDKISSFEAFGNVRMEQGDTLFLYGDRLYYDGLTQIARMRDNVRMENRTTTLLTDSLNYDRVYNLGYFSTVER